MASEQLLSLSGVSKEFPGVKALNNVQFDLNVGEVHAIVGENGAGKSTLMKILSGIYKKDAGNIIYKGESVTYDGVRITLLESDEIDVIKISRT